MVSPPAQTKRATSAPIRPASDGPAVLILATLLAAASLVSAWRSARNYPAVDYHHFWIAIDAIRHRVVPDVYAESSKPILADRYLKPNATDPQSSRREAAVRRTSGIGIIGTPLLHSALSLFPHGDYDFDFYFFEFASMTAFVAGVFLLARTYSMPLILILLIIAWFGSFFGPLLADLRSGNVNRLQFSLIALLTWLLANDEDPSSDAAAGAVLAFAVLFKPNLMMVAGMLFWYWIVALRWRRLAWCAAGALIGGTASLAASAAFFGTFGCWRNWSDIAANMKDEWFPIDLGNYSLSESILAGTGTRPGTWLATVIIGTALSLVAWAARRARAADARQSDFLICRAPEPVLIAVGCGLWTLTAHLAWYHYSVLALPLVIWTLRPFSELPAASMVWRCVQRTIGVIALLCFHPVVGGEMFTRSRWVWPLVLNIVVALLIAVALAERLRVSRNRNVS